MTAAHLPQLTLMVIDPLASSNLSLRERKKLRVRRKLAEAASRLFREHGFESVRAEDIAAQAEVSPNTLFRYFLRKHSLLGAAFELILQESMRDAWVEGGGLDLDAWYAAFSKRLSNEVSLVREVFAHLPVGDVLGRLGVGAPPSECEYGVARSVGLGLLLAQAGSETGLPDASALVPSSIVVQIARWLADGKEPLVLRPLALR